VGEGTKGGEGAGGEGKKKRWCPLLLLRSGYWGKGEREERKKGVMERTLQVRGEGEKKKKNNCHSFSSVC